MDTKSTIDAIMSGATNASFAIPEAGVFIAAGLSIGTALFDILYPPETINPDDMDLTVGQFQKAEKDMKVFIAKEVTQDLNNSERNSYLVKAETDLGTLNGYLLDPDSMTKGPYFPVQNEGEKQSDYNKRKQDAFDKAHKKWTDGLNIFGAPIMANHCMFLDALNWLSLTPETRVSNLNFYMYFTNLYMNYAKLAMTWEFSIAQKKFLFEKNLSAEKLRTNNMAKHIWAIKHPGEPFPDQTPTPEFDQRGLGNDSQYINRMTNKASGIIPHLKIVRDAVNEAGKRWNKREARIAEDLSSYRVVTHSSVLGLTFFWESRFNRVSRVGNRHGGDIIIVDKPSDAPHFYKTPVEAHKAMESAMAAKKPKLFKKYGDDLQISDLTLDKIHKYDAIVKVWENTILNITEPPTPVSALLPPPPSTPEHRTEHEVLTHTLNGHVFIGDG